MAERILEHQDGGRPRQAGRRSSAVAARRVWSGAILTAVRHAARRCSFGLTRKFSLFLAGLLGTRLSISPQFILGRFFRFQPALHNCVQGRLDLR